MAVIVFSNLKCLRKPGEPREAIRYLGDAWDLEMTHFLVERKVFIRVAFSSPSRFKKGFESEPTLHSGINYAVLLLAAGHQFDTSFELRKVGKWTL